MPRAHAACGNEETCMRFAASPRLLLLRWLSVRPHSGYRVRVRVRLLHAALEGGLPVQQRWRLSRLPTLPIVTFFRSAEAHLQEISRSALPGQPRHVIFLGPSCIRICVPSQPCSIRTRKEKTEGKDNL